MAREELEKQEAKDAEVNESVAESVDESVEEEGTEAVAESELETEAVDSEQEAEKAREEALEQKLAELLNYIRHQSREGELVNIADLKFAEDFPEEDRAEVMARLEASEEIKRLEASDGRVFLYSSAFMVDRYAKTLLQREENDPRLLVAETVREESQLYPRPTPVNVFTLPPYKLPKQILDTVVAELVADEGDYADIKEVIASTGARYLYSDRHLEKQYAEYLVEWQEVGQYENQ